MRCRDGATLTHMESCVRERSRDDLARIAHGSTPLTVSRPEIVSSWQASLVAGLRPDHLVVPFEGEVDLDDPVIRAACPAADRLAVDLAHTDVSVVLSDANGRVVTRHSPPSCTSEFDQMWLNPGYAWRLDTAGTTALGLATRSRRPVVVDGPEHFMDAQYGLTTASAPIQDTTTARVLGALTLVSPERSAHALLLPVARRAAHEIECLLVDAATGASLQSGDALIGAPSRARIAGMQGVGSRAVA
jgi:transcriptional regulator of acetoin/glycerol metabolism